MLRRRSLLGAGGLLLAPAWAGAAGPGLATAVMVEVGYRMDVVSQSMSYDYESWTLFDDGSVYRHLPAAALPDFDIAAARRKQPAAWGEWRRQDGKLEVRWPQAGAAAGTWTAPRKWFELTVPAEGQTLNAIYTVLGTSAQAGLFTSSFASGWKELTFHADGRFDQVAGGSADATKATGGSVLATQVQSGGGRYRIRGPLLELQFADGRTLRASLFFSSPDQKTMLLNGTRLRLRSKL
jgi:hypothetical protein